MPVGTSGSNFHLNYAIFPMTVVTDDIANHLRDNRNNVLNISCLSVDHDDAMHPHISPNIPVQVRAGQGRTGQGKTGQGQGRAGQGNGRARQGRAGQGRTMQGRAEQGQDTARLHRTAVGPIGTL